jgi:hypothetical protein
VQVGEELAESHTRIITIDTVSVLLSSYVLDSFVTNNNNFSLIGNYFDSYSGKTTTSTFFQPGLPVLSQDASTLMPKDAKFDSLMLYMHPSGYYYGDTTKPYEISVYELAEQPAYTYFTYFYNNSSVPLKSPALATYSGKIRPTPRDSIKIRMPDSMGQDFFFKIQNKDNKFASSTSFLDYFRGLCIKPTNNTGGAVYGFNLADSSIRMRLHFHTSLPYKTDNFVDFIITNTSYQFNRIVSDRTGTMLQPTTQGQHEFFPTASAPYAITQAGTGVYLKVRFPSLRDVLKVDEVVRLMDAKLILKPVKGSYEYFTNSLPSPLYLQTTDASNIPHSMLLDTTGQGIQYRAPSVDFTYGVSTNYTFNITSYINSLLMSGTGTQDMGLFVIQDAPETAKEINRGVIGIRQNSQYETKLILNILTID